MPWRSTGPPIGTSSRCAPSCAGSLRPPGATCTYRCTTFWPISRSAGSSAPGPTPTSSERDSPPATASATCRGGDGRVGSMSGERAPIPSGDRLLNDGIAVEAPAVENLLTPARPPDPDLDLLID